MVKEKLFMTSFVASNLADLAVSKLGWESGFQEIGIGAAPFIEQGEDEKLIAAKFAVVFGLTLLTASLTEAKMKRAAFVAQGGLAGASVAIWSGVIWNLSQILKGV